ESNISLSHMEDDIDQNQVNFLGEFDFVTTQRNALDWQNNLRLNATNLLTAGLYISREDTESLSFGTAFDVSTDVDAVYVQDVMNFNAHQLVLATRYTDHETAGSETTWNIDYGYDLSEKLKLTAAAGTAFRAPDSTDRFGFGGNPNLRSETARNLEIGLRWRLSSNQNLTVSIFDTQIDDLITIDFSQFPSTAQNIEKASIRGIELRHDLVKGNWRYSSEVILQETEDEQTGAPLPRRADRSLSSSISRLFGRHEISLNLLATDERKDSPFSQIINAGYVLLNLQGRLQINPKLSLNGKIENLLDRDYQTAAGFNNPDRSVFVSLNYTMR
ncbi:MAG: TonB-dependent receptor, partial [Gammaproteobacteria bacterium]